MLDIDVFHKLARQCNKAIARHHGFVICVIHLPAIIARKIMCLPVSMLKTFYTIGNLGKTASRSILTFFMLLIYPSSVPCADDQCQNGGTCQVQGSGFSCLCEDGFSGNLCHITDGMYFKNI